MANYYQKSTDDTSFTAETVGVVFRLDSVPATAQRLFSLGDDNVTDKGWGIEFTDVGTVRGWRSVSGPAIVYTNQAQFESRHVGKYFAVAMTMENASEGLKLYVNGNEIGTSVTPGAAIATPFGTGAKLTVGASVDGDRQATSATIFGCVTASTVANATKINQWYEDCRLASNLIAALPDSTNTLLLDASDAVNLPSTWTDAVGSRDFAKVNDGAETSEIVPRPVFWGATPDVYVPPLELYYITNTSGASAYRASTGAGFRGSSTSTTAVVVYLEPDFTAASGVLAGYGTVGSTGHSWDFQIYNDGTKYAIRPRLRTTSGAENGAAYRIQSSDVGTILTCVATFDGTYLRTYVNGCLVGSVVITGTYTPNATQGLTLLNNNLLNDPVLNTENVGLVACLTANSVLTPSQINTWHNDTVSSVDGMPPVFPGGVTVNRWIANDAFDDPSVNDAANAFVDTAGSVTVQQVVADTQAVSSVLASAYSTEIAVPAFRFTGSDNFESVNHAIGNSNTPFTVNLLVHTSYAPNTGSNEGVLSYRQNGASRGWGIRRINSTGNLDFFAFNGSAALVNIGTAYTTTGETVRNRTHLMTVSHDGTYLRCYVDGTQIGSTTACTGYTLPKSADSLIVGDTAGINLPFLSGAIVGFSVVEGTAWQETEHDALYTSILAANDMVDDGTYAATAVWAASDNTAVGNWLDIAGGNSITKVGTPPLVYVARSRFGPET